MPVILPDEHSSSAGYITGMELKGILRRVHKRLKAVDKSPDGASKEAGKPDAIRNMERAVESGDRKGVTTGTLQALAPVLKTRGPWLVFGIGPETDEEAQLPVWGKAGAGGIVNSFHEDTGPIGHIDWVDGSNESTGAVEISGGSLGKPFDGWYAIYDEVRHPPTEDLFGQLCVVETEDGRVYIKQLIKEPRGKTFTLESSSGRKMTGIRLNWAARVKGLVPK